MSYFLAGALITLAFNLLHTFSMMIAFDGLREGKRERWAAVPIAHLAAALLVSYLNLLLCTIKFALHWSLESAFAGGRFLGVPMKAGKFTRFLASRKRTRVVEAVYCVCSRW